MADTAPERLTAMMGRYRNAVEEQSDVLWGLVDYWSSNYRLQDDSVRLYQQQLAAAQDALRQVAQAAGLDIEGDHLHLDDLLKRVVELRTGVRSVDNSVSQS
jgi:hypothetical protein